MQLQIVLYASLPCQHVDMVNFETSLKVEVASHVQLAILGQRTTRRLPMSSPMYTIYQSYSKSEMESAFVFKEKTKCNYQGVHGYLMLSIKLGDQN